MVEQLKTHTYILLIAIISIHVGCIQKIKTKVEISEIEKKSVSFQAQIDTTRFYPINKSDSLEPIYSKYAAYLWNNFVPAEGQAETLQGELIRALEKLEHEITGNGKINWNEQHVRLAESLKHSLVNSGIFPTLVQNEINADVNRLTDDATIYTDDDVYNRLTSRIGEWYWRNKKPIKKVKDPKLKI